MQNFTRAIFATLLLLTSGLAAAQENITTVGIQFRPIVPSEFFGAGEETVQAETENVEATFIPRMAYTFGMVIRVGLTDMISLETGINYVRRNYSIELRDNDNGFAADMDFRFIGYEIPLQGLLYVRLGDKIWMNASTGVSFDTYPSDVETIEFDYRQQTRREYWGQFSLLANVGFEYRTDESGYFYFGGSFHQPFQDVARTRVTYQKDGIPVQLFNNLNGTYLTLDFRYFFHEEQERR
ncbi:hypothetical protein [Halocola ammonii]